MNGLTQVQPIASAQGQLVALLGLRDDGKVFFGEVRGTGPGTYSIEWAPIQESEKK